MHAHSMSVFIIMYIAYSQMHFYEKKKHAPTQLTINNINNYTIAPASLIHSTFYCLFSSTICLHLLILQTEEFFKLNTRSKPSIIAGKFSNINLHMFFLILIPFIFVALTWFCILYYLVLLSEFEQRMALF